MIRLARQATPQATPAQAKRLATIARGWGITRWILESGPVLRIWTGDGSECVVRADGSWGWVVR